MAPPFRADQVGSLLRPKSLVEARKNSNLPWNNLRAGPAQDDGSGQEGTAGAPSHAINDPIRILKAEQDRTIKEVVADQISRGILPITTGEYERGIFYGNFFESLSGFEMRYTPMEDFTTGFPTNRPLIEWGVPGRDAGYPTAKRVTLEKSAYLDDWLFLRSLLTEERWKDAKVSCSSAQYNLAVRERENSS